MINIENITEIITSWGALIGATGATLGGLYKLYNIVKKYRESNHGVRLLEKHFYFHRMRYYLNGYISNLKLSDKCIDNNVIRMYVSKVFIYDKVETFYNIMLPLAKEIEKTHQLKSINGIENILDVIVDGITTYENKARKKGIPDLFIKRFGDYHETQVNMVVSGINSIIHNKIYNSIEERFSAILDILIGAFTMIMPHIGETLDSLNGELTKKLDKLSDEDIFRLKIYSKRTI